MQRSNTKLVLGRGRLYFNAFALGTQTGTGERYIGNTPAFSISRSVESVTRVRSINGLRYKSDPIVVSENLSASVSTDNISSENFAHWFHATEKTLILPGKTFERNLVADHSNLIKLFDAEDGYNQSTNIVGLEVFRGTVEVALLGNFDTQMLQYGLLSILPSARDVFDGDSLRLKVRIGESKVAPLEPSNKSLQGSLRFLSNNIVGPDFDYLFPVVSITPSGSIDLKGDDFQQIVFSVEVLKLNSSTPHYFIRVLEKFSPYEQAILDTTFTLEDFVVQEELFNYFMNDRMPDLHKPVRPLRFWAPFTVRGPDLSDLFYADACLDGLLNEALPGTMQHP